MWVSRTCHIVYPGFTLKLLYIRTLKLFYFNKLVSLKNISYTRCVHRRKQITPGNSSTNNTNIQPANKQSCFSQIVCVNCLQKKNHEHSDCTTTQQRIYWHSAHVLSITVPAYACCWIQLHPSWHAERISQSSMLNEYLKVTCWISQSSTLNLSYAEYLNMLN